MSVLKVIPGAGFSAFGSLDDTIANRSPFGSHEKSKTLSGGREREFISTGSLRQRTFVVNYLDGKILISHSEDLEVVGFGFLRLCMTADFYTQEVTLVLPIELTLKIHEKLQEKEKNVCSHLIH